MIDNEHIISVEHVNDSNKKITVNYSLSGYKDEKNKYSILKIIDRNSIYFKNQILNFRNKYALLIYKTLMENNIGNDDFKTLFFMSSFIESNVFKNADYSNAIKILAFINQIKNFNVLSISYSGSDIHYMNCILEYCQFRNIQFKKSKYLAFNN